MSTKLIHANPDTVKKLKVLAAIKGAKLQELTNEAIEAYIKANEVESNETTTH